MTVKTLIATYYAIIFTTISSEEDKGYSEMADVTLELAEQQDGFLWVESAR